MMPNILFTQTFSRKTPCLSNVPQTVYLEYLETYFHCFYVTLELRYSQNITSRATSLPLNIIMNTLKNQGEIILSVEWHTS